jgi:hypothetical protein
MEFTIGTNVKIKEYDELPEAVKNKSVGRLAGHKAEIVDKVFSEAKGEDYYLLKVEGRKSVSTVCFTEDAFDEIKEEMPTYRYEFEYLPNVVVARLYEGDVLVARGHGHIIHEGAIGIAQASSYALKRIYEDLNGGHMRRYIGHD